MNQYPIRKGEVVQSASSEGWTIYQTSSDSLHVLNASAKAIWDLCDGRTSAEEMATAIAELTGIRVADATDDVRNVLEKLERLGLVSSD